MTHTAIRATMLPVVGGGRCVVWLFFDVLCLGGEVFVESRRGVARYALDAEPLEGADDPVDHLTVGVQINLLAEHRAGFQLFALQSDGGATPGQLFLRFRQSFHAA